MNIDNLTIDERLKAAAQAELCGSTTNGPREIPGHGRYVIVRSRDAGVQYGKLDRYTENGTVYLTDARQMWSWVAAEGGTLLDCATHGVTGGKFSTKAPSVIILNACAIIDCTEKAVASLESVQWA